MGSRFLDLSQTGAFEVARPHDQISTVLARLGLTDVAAKTPAFEAALAVALRHESYLHEHRLETPGLTRGLLRALDGLGNFWISRELTLSLVRRRHDATPGETSKTVAAGKVAIAKHVAQHEEWVEQCGLFGASMTGAKPPGAINRVFHQVVGLVALLGHENSLRPYLRPIVAAASSEVVIDWYATLQTELRTRKAALEWETGASGPDHAKIFTVTAVAGSRWRATATGSSLKAARAAACEAMVRESFPHVLRGAIASESAPVPPGYVPRSTNPALNQTVGRIAASFALSAEATPLLAQAFLHTSWTYENRKEVAASRQRDNGVLGFIGSTVVEYEAALSQTLQAAIEPPDAYVFLTPERDMDVEALRLLSVEPAITLGRGQRLTGLTDEIRSTAFQGLIGALFLTLDAPRSVFERWPAAEPWHRVAEVIAPSLGRGHDAQTRLQEFASATGLVYSFSYVRSGPDHDSKETASLVLDSPLLRRRLTVHGEPVSGKTRARRAAAAVVTQWIDLLRSAPGLSRVSASKVSGPGPTFLITHLCAAAAGYESFPPMNWRRADLFGWSLDGPELRMWAQAVDQALARQTQFEPDVERLVAYFRRARGAGDESFALTDALIAALDWVESIEPLESVDAGLVRHLVVLASAYRALGGDQSAIPLSSLLDAQVLLGRGRVKVSGQPPGASVTPATAAALESLLSTFTERGGAVVVDVERDGQVVISRAEPPEAGAVVPAPWAELWRAIGVDFDVHEEAGTVTVRVGNPLAATGPIDEAVTRASASDPSAIAEAVANLLHDLKNQISAAQALAAAQTGESRTARLEREVGASRHLDQAAALAARIRAAKSLLTSSAADAMPLASSLRRYASATLVRIPPTISLVVGSGADDVAVTMSEAALTAVLDNLIKNAIEAMPTGGRLTLDWTNDDDFAVIELTDEGPGLPLAVQQAFRSGGRIESTKAGGNGLGLIGVRALVRGTGGMFELAPSPHGTAWHITIPLVEETDT